MKESYPSRTPLSDKHAMMLRLWLDEMEPAIVGKEYMATVVTTTTGEYYVGFSGDQSRLINALKNSHKPKMEKSVEYAQDVRDWKSKIWYAALDDYMECALSVDGFGTTDRVRTDSLVRHPFKFGVDLRRENLLLHANSLNTSRRFLRATRNTATFMNEMLDATGISTKMENVQSNMSSAAKNIRESVKAEMEKPKSEQKDDEKAKKRDAAYKGYLDYLDKFNPNWNCAEPKALAAAAKAGKVIEGMSTFFVGDQNSQIYGRYRIDKGSDTNANILLWQPDSVVKNKKPPLRLMLCRPCDTCDKNQYAVMQAVANMALKTRTRGANAAFSAEAPGRLQSR